jgi:hypothetical protein
VFEPGKLPGEIDPGNMLELFLRAFRAGTEEELEALEKLGVHEMNEMAEAYREITGSPDYADLERRRVMSRLDEGQALNNARRKGAEEERAKWQKKVEADHAKWQSVVSDKDAEIARLRAELGQ